MTDVKAEIAISCDCGWSSETYEYRVTLWNEDYTPEEYFCPKCGQRIRLCIHQELLEDDNDKS